jgi:hypothetical protein
MAVGGREQPEQQLRLEQGPEVVVAGFGVLEDSGDVHQPGPPSDSYLARGDVPVAWQKSSWGRRAKSPVLARRRSKRSTTSTFWSSKR